MENMDRITESSHKNGIYCIYNIYIYIYIYIYITEFAKFWMDKSKVGHYI